MTTRLKMIFLVSLILTLGSLNASASRVGDDAGNGGFAFKQSIKILRMATAEVVEKVRRSDFPDLVRNPDRREVLERALQYLNLVRLPNQDVSRGERLLAMDYVINPPTVKVYKAFYMSFAGTLDMHLAAASKEVQKRLLHEASHIWGFDEQRAEKFSLDFLEHDGDIFDDVPDRSDVVVKNDHCICEDGVSIGSSSCEQFCAARISSSETLFGNINLNQSDSEIRNLHDWCNKELPSGGHISPQCSMEVYDGNETISLAVVTNRSNQFTVNLDPLKKDKTYVLKLVSTTGAESTAFQIRMSANIDPVETLLIESLNRYYCVVSSGMIRDGDYNSINSVNQHYTFTERLMPMPIPPDFDSIFCHDREIYGDDDSFLFPRLGLVNNSGSLWSSSNPNFMDLNGDGKEDINTEIEQTLRDQYNINISLDLFINFTGQDDPLSSQSTVKGKLLRNFIDPATGRNFCPTRYSYNSENPLLHVLGKYLSIDTEQVYMARRETIRFDDGTIAPEDNLFLSKSTLNPIWFYIERGMHFSPTEEDRFTKTLYFYWPADHNNPFVKKSYQKMYRISVSDHDMSSADKSFACAPKMNSSVFDPRGHVGESCKSDSSCLSGCCNEATGTCSEHNPELGQSCQKNYGQSCISDEFCKEQVITACRILKTGYDASGNITCALSCYNEQKSGSCVKNICLPTETPSIPYLDPLNPDCSSAQ